MSRQMYVGGMAFVLMILFLSCKNNQPVSPPIQPELTVHINGLDGAITAPEGQLYTTDFEVHVSDQFSVPVEGVPVDLWVESGPGDVTLGADATNRNGVVEAFYAVIVPIGSNVTVIKASSEFDTTEAVILLTGEPVPAGIALTCEEIITTRYNIPHEAELNAAVVTSGGAPVPGVYVQFELVSGQAQVGGVVETDDEGIAITEIVVDGTWFGDLIVSATVVEPPGTLTSNSSVSSLTLNSRQTKHLIDQEAVYAEIVIPVRLESPVHLRFVTPDADVSVSVTLDRLTVRAQLTDEDQYPVVGVPLLLTVDDEIGSFVSAEPVTDENGFATTDLVLGGNVGVGTAEVRFIPLNLSDSFNIEVTDGMRGIAEMRIINPGQAIWADSSYTVEVQVLDHLGVGIVGVGTRLSSVLGEPEGVEIPTDGNGIAPHDYMPLRGGEERLNVESDDVELLQPPLEFTVYEAPLSLTGTLEYDLSGDPYKEFNYRFRIVDVLDQGIRGEQLRFEVSSGWLDRRDATTDWNGDGVVGIFWDGQSPVNGELTVYWREQVFRRPFQFRAGLPHHIEMSYDGSGLVSARVLDEFDNPVERGTQVRFAVVTGRATITPSAFTDSDGYAYSRFSPGIFNEPVEIEATSGEARGLIRIEPLPDPFSWWLELSASPIDILVAGHGEASTATLTARLYDGFNNPVETPVPIVFELVREPPEPLGCNINNRGQKDTVLTVQGEAQAFVNAGTQIGPIMLRAYTLDEEGNPTDVEAMNSNVAVVAGPPASIEIYVHNADNPGFGIRYFDINLRPFDRFHNRVSENWNIYIGDTCVSQEGGGWTHRVYYRSTQAFDTLTIRAVIDTLDIFVSAEREYILPLVEGQLELHVEPDHWEFITDAPHDSLHVRVRAVLTDEQDNLINNAPILFSSNRARFFYQIEDEFFRFNPDPSIRYTGPGNDGANEFIQVFDDDPDGTAVVWLRGSMHDFFLDPFTLEVTVQIEARVVGYGAVAADPLFLFVTRRPPE